MRFAVAPSLDKLVLLLPAALLLCALPARADIPPPAGYVESCTVARACKSDEEADVCNAFYSESERCQKLHASDGFAHRCNSRGATSWSEVWCRPKSLAKSAPKTAATVKPVQPANPAQPVESLKAVESLKQSEDVKSAEAAKSVDTAKPVEAANPVETARPVPPTVKRHGKKRSGG